jgi:signal transduction histidine kinase
MVVVSLAVVGITTYLLFRTAMDEEKARLVEAARSQARLIEAIARFDAVWSEDYPGGPLAATMSQIDDAHEHYEGFGNTGEFTLARRQEDEIVFLLSHRHYDLTQPKPVPFDSDIAEPMRQALLGASGTLIGLDYRGEVVLAAHEPVEDLGLGIVAKIDMAEIRAPFLRAGGIAVGCALFVVLLGSVLFFRVRNPIIRSLQLSLQESSESQSEIQALLKGARAVLEYKDFKSAAGVVFGTCKRLIGAQAGYVALLTQDGQNNEVVLLDSGGLPCSVDPSLPMPIRGLRAQAYHNREVVIDNEFSTSEWTTCLPEGHAAIRNVLFAPLVIDQKTVGLLGLANKPTEFTESDSRVALAFAEYAAIALRSSRAIESLSDSEERFRSVAESANDAIISIDHQGLVAYWNEASEAVFGYRAAEITGKPMTIIMPQRFREAHEAGLARVVETGESRSGGWIAGGTVYFTGMVRDITERINTTRELQEHRQHLEELVERRTHELRQTVERLESETIEREHAEVELRLLNERLVQVQEAERQHIAHELHDEIGQALTALNLHLARARTLSEENIAPHIRDAQGMVEELVEHIRDVSLNLRPGMLDDVGLVPTLNWHLKRFESQTGISVDFTHSGVERRFGRDLELGAYRIVQEALTNVARHSASQKATVALGLKNDHLWLQVEDKGVGLPMHTDRGLGILGMRERAASLGGLLDVTSEPSVGTCVVAELPLHQKQSARKGGGLAA